MDGGVTPDIIRISRKNPGKLSHTSCGTKRHRMALTTHTQSQFNTGTCTTACPQHERDMLSLDEPSLLTLARWGFSLEKYFRHPQDIEWCRDTSGHLFILQSRPLHLDSMELRTNKQTKQSRKTKIKAHTILCTGGKKVCSGIASGPVYKLNETYHLENMPRGSVLVVRHAPPQFITAIENMAARHHVIWQHCQPFFFPCQGIWGTCRC